MGFLFFLVLVFTLIVLCDQSSTSKTPKNNSAPPQHQTQVVKKTVPPTGRSMSWDKTEDISFALGCFISGLGAGGWIGAYEDGTLIFNIRNFSSTFSSIHEKVPSDVIDFLAKRPSILKRQQVGEHTLFQIEFSKSFPISYPREHAIYSILNIVQANLLDGVRLTKEITGVGKLPSVCIESHANTDSKELWIR